MASCVGVPVSWGLFNIASALRPVFVCVSFWHRTWIFTRNNLLHNVAFGDDILIYNRTSGASSTLLHRTSGALVSPPPPFTHQAHARHRPPLECPGVSLMLFLDRLQAAYVCTSYDQDQPQKWLPDTLHYCAQYFTATRHWKTHVSACQYHPTQVMINTNKLSMQHRSNAGK